MNIEDERRKFEAWVNSCSLVAIRDPDFAETYAHPTVRFAWEAWLARAETEAKIAESHGDMFWTEDCQEYSFPSIDEMVEGWIEAGTDDGTVVEVSRAMRLPSIFVELSVDDDDGSYSWRIISPTKEDGE